MKNIKILFSLILFFAVTLLYGFPKAAHAMNPVVWKTNYAKLAASDLYIRIGNTYYYGADDIRVSSDPGSERTTLELSWNENQRPMRLYLYFRTSSSNEWELYDVRSYDGSQYGEWIYYTPQDSFGNEISSLKGMQHYREQITFLPKSNVDAEIYCHECSITAFLDIPLDYSESGYALEVLNGLEANETITVSTNPSTGYGVNVLLKDTDGNIVVNQENIQYRWQPRNTSIVEVQSMNLEYDGGSCAYGMNPPCPNINGQIRGLSEGVTTVDVTVVRSGEIIAENKFDVKVVDQSPISTPSPTPTSTPTQTVTPTTTPTPSPTASPVSDQEVDYEKFQEELEVLKGAVGEIELETERQRNDINVLQRLVESILNFFKNFGF